MPYNVAGWRTAGRLDVVARFADGSVLAIEIDRANKRASVHKLQLARQRLRRWRCGSLAWCDDGAAGWHSTFRPLGRRRPAGCFGRPTMFPTAHALLHALPDARLAEVFDTPAAAGPVRIERIVSHGQASPEGFWYDQAQAEWVMVVQAARLAFADGEVALAAGIG